MTTSFLALVPKSEIPQGLDDYRTICLVGCMYKVLSKRLASRLRKMMDKLISSNQTNFISGRHILDGVLITNEIIYYDKRMKKDC